MLFKKIPKELIIKIFSYDKTYHDNYKKCTKEIKNLIKCYPKKKIRYNSFQFQVKNYITCSIYNSRQVYI